MFEILSAITHNFQFIESVNQQPWPRNHHLKTGNAVLQVLAIRQAWLGLEGLEGLKSPNNGIQERKGVISLGMFLGPAKMTCFEGDGSDVSEFHERSGYLNMTYYILRKGESS